MDMLSTQTLCVYNKWPCLLKFYLVNSPVIHVVAIWCETLSLCLPTHAQRGEICDAAAKLPHNGWLFSKRKHTFAWARALQLLVGASQRNNSLSHWCWIPLLSAIFTALRQARTPTLRQVSGSLMGKKKKKKTCRATCTIGAFCHVFTDVPSGVTLKPNRSGSNRSATAAKSSWLSNSHWNVEECTRRINPSSSARFWLEVIAERQSGPRRQKKE